MTSFRISITPSRKAAARFVTNVRRALLQALAQEREKTGLNQSEIARRIGVHRSVVSRQLKGIEDLTLGRIAELAYAMNREAVIVLQEPSLRDGSNERLHVPTFQQKLQTSSASSAASLLLDRGQTKSGSTVGAE